MEKYLYLLNMKNIHKQLHVSKTTIKRWIDTKKIPENYIVDMKKLNKEEIDYSQMTYKEKDQFFTCKTLALECVKDMLDKLTNPEEYIWIEPSAGKGVFIDALKELLPNANIISFDIEKNDTCKECIIQDFLEWNGYDPAFKYIVFGNPPFGLRGNMALRFINHASVFADYVCFVLPPLFSSDGKGSPSLRIPNMNLIYSVKNKENTFFDPENNSIKVQTIFQIYKKEDKKPISRINSKEFKVYSLSNGESSHSKRNVKMIGKCDYYLPSTCYKLEQVKEYDNFEDLPNQRGYGVVFKQVEVLSLNWKEYYYKSTNSSYNIRSSVIIEALKLTLEKKLKNKSNDK